MLTTNGARIALTLACIAPTVVSGAALAAKAPSLTITSVRGNATTELRLSGDLRIAREQVTLSWTGCGPYAGFYLRPLDGQRIAGTPVIDGTGALDVMAFASPGGSELRSSALLGDGAWHGGKDVVIPRGRYRAHIFGEGRCEVRVPVRGGLSSTRRIVADTPAQVQFEYANLTPAKLPVSSPTGGAASLPLTVDEATLAVSIMHTLSRTDAVDKGMTGTTCIDETPVGACPLASRHDAAGRQVNIERRYVTSADGTWASSLDYVGYYPGYLSDNAHYGKSAAAGSTGSRQAAMAVFAFRP